MKIDFSTVLTDFRGKDMVSQDEDHQPLTLAYVSIAGLMRVDQKDDGKARFDLYNLAKRIDCGGVVEIEPKEAETIKTRIGAAFGQVVVGPAWKILNG